MFRNSFELDAASHQNTAGDERRRLGVRSNDQHFWPSRRDSICTMMRHLLLLSLLLAIQGHWVGSVLASHDDESGDPAAMRGWVTESLARLPSEPVAIEPSFQEPQEPLPLPKMSGYERQMRSFVKNTRHELAEVRRAAIYNLCHLHAVVVSDPRFQTHDKLKSIRVSIARHLARWERESQKEQARIAKRSGVVERDPRLSKSGAKAADEEGPSGQNSGHPFLASLKDELDVVMLQTVSASHATLYEVTGGPAVLFEYAGGKFAPPWDHAPELMALLRKTIDPNTWRVAGGNSSMSYYQPSMALVVRAPQRVQDEICELLFKLRAAF